MDLELQSPHGELRTAFYNPHEVKRRQRTSRSQFKTLEKAFGENPKPDASTRRHLAQRLSMSPRGIQVWFQNRRAKNKQSSNTVAFACIFGSGGGPTPAASASAGHVIPFYRSCDDRRSFYYGQGHDRSHGNASSEPSAPVLIEPDASDVNASYDTEPSPLQ
ncbi:hypothetical protein BGZ99_003365 [Dissophora globulifera]|uniref:Homeobox domain-containing protein n=1 Tax=Dissophora globulifera TaxID=979702 RepID=A0A9P6RN75_9FUNG|nr:hypothetical protein BGZ99_003365 [Dissophora globulifera]